MDLRVLLVDAEPAARAVSAGALQAAGVTVAAEAATGEEAVRLARITAPTVVVVDVALPGMGAATAVRRMRDTAGRRLEVVATAAFADVARLGELASTGTAAFVVKGKPDDLVAAVRAVAAGSGMLSAEASRPVLEEVQRLYERERSRNEELEKLVSQLQALSVTDWLTGLKNHGYFFDRLAEELERARRYGRPLAVIMADLDDFKAVNDAFGHAAGDTVLRAMGDVFRTQLREVDIACRIGGEEFGLIMPETGADGAVQAAERIRMAVERQQVGGMGKVTISLGVAVFPEHAQHRDELMEVADRALYQAKREGKNCTRLAGAAGPLSEVGKVRVTGGPVVTTLLAALRMRAPQVADHCVRSADLAVGIGSEMGLLVNDLERLRLAALLSHVGMLAVSDDILSKEAPLTEEEWGVIRNHPHNSFELIFDAVHDDVAQAVLTHHEHIDGSGYPQGLQGDEIPVLARILLVASAFDAMTTEKVYQQARSTEEAVAELRRHAGTQFDAEAVAAVEALIHRADREKVAEVLPFRRAHG